VEHVLNVVVLLEPVDELEHLHVSFVLLAIELAPSLLLQVCETTLDVDNSQTLYHILHFHKHASCDNHLECNLHKAFCNVDTDEVL
jgi:hypothetical protein